MIVIPALQPHILSNSLNNFWPMALAEFKPYGYPFSVKVHELYPQALFCTKKYRFSLDKSRLWSNCPR